MTPLCVVVVFLSACVLGSSAVKLVAQQATTPAEKFEVASVRENTSDDGKILFGIQPGGRFNAHNVPLWDLIRQAYGVQRTQLVGAPDWAESARVHDRCESTGELCRADLVRRQEANFMRQIAWPIVLIYRRAADPRPFGVWATLHGATASGEVLSPPPRLWSGRAAGVEGVADLLRGLVRAGSVHFVVCEWHPGALLPGVRRSRSSHRCCRRRRSESSSIRLA